MAFQSLAAWPFTNRLRPPTSLASFCAPEELAKKLKKAANGLVVWPSGDDARSREGSFVVAAPTQVRVLRPRGTS